MGGWRARGPSRKRPSCRPLSVRLPAAQPLFTGGRRVAPGSLIVACASAPTDRPAPGPLGFAASRSRMGLLPPAPLAWVQDGFSRPKRRFRKIKQEHPVRSQRSNSVRLPDLEGGPAPRRGSVLSPPLPPGPLECLRPPLSPQPSAKQEQRLKLFPPMRGIWTDDEFRNMMGAHRGSENPGAEGGGGGMPTPPTAGPRAPGIRSNSPPPLHPRYPAVCVMFGSSWCNHCHEVFPVYFAASKVLPRPPHRSPGAPARRGGPPRPPPAPPPARRPLPTSSTTSPWLTT